MLKWRRKGAATNTQPDIAHLSTNADSDQQPPATLDPNHVTALLALPAPPSGDNFKLKESSLLFGNRTGVVVRRIIDRDTSDLVSKAVRFQLTKRIYLELRSAEVLSQHKAKNTNITNKPAHRARPVSDQIENLS